MEPGAIRKYGVSRQLARLVFYMYDGMVRGLTADADEERKPILDTCAGKSIEADL